MMTRVVFWVVFLFAGAAQAQQVPHPVGGPATSTLNEIASFNSALGNALKQGTPATITSATGGTVTFPTTGGMETTKTIASTDNSVLAPTTAWVKQFFPGLATNLLGANIGPGMNLSGCVPGNCTWFIYATPSTVAQGDEAALRVQRDASYSGGTIGNTVKAIWVLATTSPNGVSFEWPLTAEMNNESLATTGSENVALNSTVFKRYFTTPATITQAAPAVVTPSNMKFVNNNTVKFTTTGVLPSPLVVGTTYYVVSAAATNFRLSATSGGAAITTTTAGSGTHTLTMVGQIGKTFAANFNCTDSTGVVNPVSSCVGTEIDSRVIPGAGTDINRQRVILHVAAAGGQAGDHVGIGINIGPNEGMTIDRGIFFSSGAGIFDIGIDLTEPTFTTAAILGSASAQTALAWQDTGGLYDATHGMSIFAAIDNNMYIENKSDMNIVFRGPNGINRAVLGPLNFTLNKRLVLTDITPTVASSQVGLGINTAAAESCGGGAATGCWVINVSGTPRYVPYY